MESKDIRRHCPEVDRLMGGKLPFVTRYGITLVAVALAVVVVLLLLSGGESHKLLKEMIENLLVQISKKIM